MTRRSKAAVFAACALAVLIPTVFLLVPRIAASSPDHRMAKEAERDLLSRLAIVRGDFSKSHNYSSALRALVECAHDYDQAAATNTRVHGLLSAARDSVAAVVVSWGLTDLWNRGSEMPDRWKMADPKLGFAMERLQVDSVTRLPGDDSTRLRRLFLLAMDEGWTHAVICLSIYERDVAYNYGSPSEVAKECRWVCGTISGKISSLYAIYRTLYGQGEADLFLTKHHLPPGQTELLEFH
jgi:hypothetical protein